MAKSVTKNMFTRMLVVMLCLCIGLGGVSAASLAYTMIVKSDFYQKKAAEQQLYDTEIAAARGNIYDKNKKLLATSATVWTLYAMPNSFINSKLKPEKLQSIKNEICENIARILSLDSVKLMEKLEKKVSYVILQKKIEQDKADEIRKFIAESENGLSQYIGLDEGTKRFYTDNTLASVILGFVGDDNQGLSGIELQYDNELTGVPGRVVAAKQANGTDMPFSYESVIEAKPGNSLVLTIDSYIQSVCEKYINQAIMDNNVTERAAAVCMNVNTGAILAMAVKGDYNLNDPFTLSESDQAVVNELQGDERTKKLSELRNKQWRNKAVSDVYDPGSVFKVVTASAAIEENVTDHSKSYYCPGYIVVAGNRYHCHKLTGHGSQNLTQSLQNSCNPVFITFGQLLGVEKFSKYFEAFGLTEKTGIDLPGESSPIYHKAENMGLTELASSSFGQTFNITPIQLITAVAAVVNGGKLVQPYLVSEVLDENQKTVSKTEPVVKRQVISAETSAEMCNLMEKVVDGGGGKNAYLAGYRIGGKTGTSQKVAKMNETGQQGLYIASFCGVAPMDHPEIALLLMFDEPHGTTYYGSSVAAPVSAHIMSEVLPYLGYEPAYDSNDLETMAVAVPDVVGKSVAAAKQALAGKGLKYKVVGNGETVERQSPVASQNVYKAGVVVLYTEAQVDFSMTKVPNFEGMTISQANAAAASAGINVSFMGTGLGDSGVHAYKQSINAGQSVESGSIVTVYFRSNESTD